MSWVHYRTHSSQLYIWIVYTLLDRKLKARKLEQNQSLKRSPYYAQDRRAFSREFNQQIVDLVGNGKSKKEIMREYNLGSSFRFVH